MSRENGSAPSAVIQEAIKVCPIYLYEEEIEDNIIAVDFDSSLVASRADSETGLPHAWQLWPGDLARFT